ncbi:MAG: DNA-binding response regulator [Flavobacteriaceae bacterium CG_4_8_14_3_um_filter_34_10]|nr:response regulator transcription factor [Flavobacteriia bacterium]OIP49866.1 MAG: DNA-binding response regulator [Flavobacteriaceae bacterium CG2_30_34_30]PIQ18844.1 MAG: DNA-binding response regulator [Flavobacteriaceae bacterium CG18_big_fil_WC_8_21_14_2_50_34_36]PIV50974.1 MAG: DNA-binding response regulator [Flavobacteriaceae bacterium CG02_land_8_20_14_3_00_34_13]PIX10516.1 MAG: DNA-binding response regulator [Flavobacteriaceae bacterium CG_4_8_14_3_um_filter_34_10]PIZ07432.1 MAG: DNA-
MRILIIEDEIGISNFLKQGLEEECFAVDVAQDGNKGLEMALSNEYDILLLDWMLPGISGIEICRQFRKENIKTPIIFLTAKDTLDETIFGLQTGANDYIKKPFHFEELLERIRVQLRTKSGEQHLFTLGNITLDINSHQVFKNEEEIQLTQKEFALLEYLIRNKGKVCRRSRIIESVWDIHFDYNTGVIDVYVNSLRKKLDFKENEEYIQTVRGIGYIAKEK